LVGQYNWFDESNQKTAVYYNIYHRGSVPPWEYAIATGSHLTDEDAVFARHPAVAMDATGNGIVVWGQRSGTDDEYEIYARVYLADGSWYAAQPIGFYDPPIYVGGDVANPQVAMDTKGNAVVVWQKYNPPDKNHVIFAQRWDHASQQWGSEAYPISAGTPSLDTPDPRIAMSANGDAIAIWQERSEAKNGIFANVLAADQIVWSSGTAQWIAQNDNLPLESKPQITMDTNGNAIVVWSLNGDSYTVRYAPATGWTTQTPEQIDAGTGDATDPQIATNGWYPGSGSERVMVVWNEDSGAGTPTNIFARLDNVSVWQPPEPIESAAGAAYYPQVAMNDSNKVRVIFKQKVTTGQGTVYQIHANRFVIGSGWEGERQIETPDHKGDVSNPQIVMNKTDLAIAAWDDGDQTAGGIIHTHVWDGWEPWGQPIASFTYAPPLPKAGDLVTFDASGSRDDGTISYEWDFDYVGSTFDTDATGVTATHSYSTAGTYAVRLRVTDDGGLTDETTQQVTVATVATLPNDPIVFESQRDMNSEIYVINPDRNGLTRLTTDAAEDREPVWSPNRKEIAFVTERDGKDEIYKMSADGTNPVRLTTLAGSGRRPAYSPDGTRIAFDNDGDGDDEIFVMNVDGTGVTQLTDNTINFDQGPSWSPDSTEILFTTFRDGDDNIYVMSADGTGQRLRVDTGEHDWQPDWSPDGTRIVFTRQGIVSGNDEIFVVNADGLTGLQQLTFNAATDEEATWSPDGNWIAFTSDRNGNRDIYVMTADGQDVMQVTTNEFDDSRPSWVH
jgi:Tol biopolymer transport system component